MELQKIYGLFPRLTGKGDKAKILADMLLRMRQENVLDSHLNPRIGHNQSFDSLIILDREVDFITPLLTQLTYEGLVDEKYGIKNSTPSSPIANLTLLALVELDISFLEPSTNPSVGSSSAGPRVASSRTRKQPLNSSDPLYASLRDVNFAIVGAVLNRMARRLSEDYEVIGAI
jgi:vacuolar protein sorting-associated protein 33A